ncbi:hypothetical protein BCR33DRAFT_392491 [Rhizoclosmatium globosum]|uniref:Uncharacterized protein n=1 Tax=Rhizoclosmatium globosum TaxID=329046 RepID=A0A1Y2BXX8_9FUNG|nr:hypothetical protein BCR33DRAFT_392491 [Rhizoclosmatium globosum]|eukprot:ORY39613.1 hypothetical protein BCR33DRAFT_392491 [Rhizoclosmatium globosum]
MEGESSSPSQPPRPAIGAASRRPSFLSTPPNPLDQITFEDCLKQLAAFDGQLQGQQQHLKGLQINLTKYIDRVKPGTIITSDQTAAYMQMTKHSSNTSLSHGYGHGQWRGTSALMKLSNMSISESIESMALKYREKKGLVLGTSKDSLASQGN